MAKEANISAKDKLVKIIFWFLLLVIELIHLKFLYKGTNILAGGDSYTHLQLARFKIYPYIWDIYAPFGSPGFITPNLLGFQLYSQLFGFLGTATLQRVMLFCLYFFKFVAFAKLVSLFKSKFSWFALFPAILLVSYNAFASLNPFGYYTLLHGVYLPFSLYYFIKLFESKKIDLVNSAKLIFLSIIFSPINANPALSATIFIPQAIYFFLNLPRLKRPTVINLFIYGSSFILVNLWWIIPLLAYFRAISANIFGSGSWFDATNASTLFHNFRFIGQWAWYSGHFLHLYYPYNVYYDHPFIIILTFLVIILAFYQAFINSKNDLKKPFQIYLSLLLIISLLLVSGTRPPLGHIYQFLIDHLPGFKIFREPFTKFTEIYVLTVSVLFYLFLTHLETTLIGVKKILIFIIITILVFLIIKPAFLGEHVWDHWNGSSRTLRIEIPQYWLDLETYANQNLKDARILATPNVSYGGAWNWPKGFSSGDDMSINFLYNDNNVLRLPLPSGSYYDPILKNFYEDFQAHKPIDKYFGLMGADYIIQENDFDWRYTTSKLTPKQANQLLALSVIKEKEFGNFSSEYLQKITNKEPDSAIRDSLYSELVDLPALVLYKVPDRLRTEKIYSPKKVHFAELNRNTNYTSILANVNFQPGDVFIAKKEIPTLVSPATSFSKINPTRYLVKVNNPKGLFLLQFTEQFNQNWKIFNKDGSKLNAEHILTNGFSNGWIIDSASDLDLIIEYTPQKQFITHLAILIVFATLSIIIILIDNLKHIFKQK